MRTLQGAGKRRTGGVGAPARSAKRGSRESYASLKAELVGVIRVLVREGLIDAFGHASVRVPGSDHVLIPGHTHLAERTVGQVAARDIVTIDLDGDVVEGRAEPPGERFIHTAIYHARPDARAIVHVHPEFVIALSAAGHPIIPVWTQGSVFAPQVPLYEYPGQINTPALGAEVAHALGSAAALVLRFHGAVIAAANLAEACVVAVNLERNARIQWLATATGGPQAIEARHIADGMMPGVSRQEYTNAYWRYYLSRLPGVSR